MSEAKTPKKAEPVSKKSEPAKTEVGKTETASTETASTETKPVDNSASKSISQPKSASQSSTSHFSSVSTPQYRSGWDNIFGDGTGTKQTVSDKVTKKDFPKKLNIRDYDVDLVLREALDVAFNDLAQKRGVNLTDAKEFLRFEYNLSCEIKEK